MRVSFTTLTRRKRGVPKKQAHDEQNRAQVAHFGLKKNPEFQALHFQVAQQLAERFYQAKVLLWVSKQAQEKEASQVPLLSVPSEWLEAFEYQGGWTRQKQKEESTS